MAKFLGIVAMKYGANMSNPVWLDKAMTYIGQREIPGKQNNPVILRWWTEIRAPFTDDETPYCAAGVGGVLEECGIRSSRSAAARSYLTWGQKLDGPCVGAIVVFERGPTHGHVGIVAGRDTRANLMVWGANQRNAVNIMPFPLHRVLGYRYPPGFPLPLTGMGTLPTLLSRDQVSSNEA